MRLQQGPQWACCTALACQPKAIQVDQRAARVARQSYRRVLGSYPNTLLRALRIHSFPLRPSLFYQRASVRVWWNSICDSIRGKRSHFCLLGPERGSQPAVLSQLISWLVLYFLLQTHMDAKDFWMYSFSRHLFSTYCIPNTVLYFQCISKRPTWLKFFQRTWELSWLRNT